MAELRWLTEADGAGWDEFADLFTRSRREAIPAERLWSAAGWRDAARHLPSHRRVFHVVAEQGGQAVGAATFRMDAVRPTEVWMMFLYVVPEQRRRGVGSQLLDAVRAVAGSSGAARISTSTYVGDAAGVAFAELAGGRPGLVTEQQRCPTASLDVAQLQAWRDRAAERASGYSLVAFDGVCPDEHVDAFVAVMPIMNTAPRMDWTEGYAPTREQVIANMAAGARQGYDHWTVCARDDRTGQFVGYTEVSVREHTPWLAAQGDTGVHPDHRERGIGRWLKASTALRLLGEKPDVEFIETWNASVNAAMLRINRAMGFAVVARRQEWDVPVSPVCRRDQ
ncbi:MAG: GNAT family N-acetyltransferase [Acidimicrobiales bacterium]